MGIKQGYTAFGGAIGDYMAHVAQEQGRVTRDLIDEQGPGHNRQGEEAEQRVCDCAVSPLSLDGDRCKREHATDITAREIYIWEHASYDGACDRGEIAVKGQGEERKGSRYGEQAKCDVCGCGHRLNLYVKNRMPTSIALPMPART